MAVSCLLIIFIYFFHNHSSSESVPGSATLLPSIMAIFHAFFLQGPPYLLARYKTAILSKFADDLKKKIYLEKKGLGVVNDHV